MAAMNLRRLAPRLLAGLFCLAFLVLPARAQEDELRKARIRSQGTTMKNDLRLIDAAKDQYAIEHDKKDMTPAWAGLTPYFSPGSRLATSPKPVDLLGNPSIIGPVETPPKISPATARALAEALDDAFWSPFR